MNTGNPGLTATILTTAITTAFAIVAGIVNHIMSGNRDRENQQKIASLKYTEQQLEELYGPLAFLIWEGRCTYTDLVKKFIEMRHQKQNNGDKDEKISPLQNQEEIKHKGDKIGPLQNQEEIELWIFWIEKDAFPRHEKIKKLLMTKTHLIEGEIMPESYRKFLDYHNSWKMEHLRWQEQQIKYSGKSKFDFPLQFETDILNTFTNLKLQQAKFLKSNHDLRKNSYIYAKIAKNLNLLNRQDARNAKKS
ncbi:hypothetical protein H6G96_16750 [Nostoc sp. FACHB-892]|uniref:hypothetical protein n=1 Tax=Nostoc sp. FACHB-892 TaxID=2692843 RepID=UPI001683103D|nr:hypothetical protein [Nostoc sp. FACHB-892]MBD2727925.1 hypothetical protein [Nostoc sp. FACHB-892]